MKERRCVWLLHFQAVYNSQDVNLSTRIRPPFLMVTSAKTLFYCVHVKGTHDFGILETAAVPLHAVLLYECFLKRWLGGDTFITLQFLSLSGGVNQGHRVVGYVPTYQTCCGPEWRSAAAAAAATGCLLAGSTGSLRCSTHSWWSDMLSYAAVWLPNHLRPQSRTWGEPSWMLTTGRVSYYAQWFKRQRFFFFFNWITYDVWQ